MQTSRETPSPLSTGLARHKLSQVPTSQPLSRLESNSGRCRVSISVEPFVVQIGAIGRPYLSFLPNTRGSFEVALQMRLVICTCGQGEGTITA